MIRLVKSAGGAVDKGDVAHAVHIGRAERDRASVRQLARNKKSRGEVGNELLASAVI